MSAPLTASATVATFSPSDSAFARDLEPSANPTRQECGRSTRSFFHVLVDWPGGKCLLLNAGSLCACLKPARLDLRLRLDKAVRLLRDPVGLGLPFPFRRCLDFVGKTKDRNKVRLAMLAALFERLHMLQIKPLSFRDQDSAQLALRLEPAKDAEPNPRRDFRVGGLPNPLWNGSPFRLFDLRLLCHSSTV